MYLAGCKGPHCADCHNPESWSFDNGTPLHEVLPRIEETCREFTGYIDHIWVLGGEPLDQDHKALEGMLMSLQGLVPAVWLWTRNELVDVPDGVRRLCDYIKTGRYDKSLKSNNYVSCGIKLASTNQQVHDLGASNTV